MCVYIPFLEIEVICFCVVAFIVGVVIGHFWGSR